MIRILLGAPGVEDEPDLVRLAGASGLQVVRRCVDAVELLAAAAADDSVQVVVSGDLPRLSVGVVERLSRERVIVGLAPDDDAERRLAALGVAVIVTADGGPESTVAAMARALLDAVPPSGVWPTDSEPGPDVAEGRVVAVWGPMGAPGRTTVAAGLAESAARAGWRVGLVDADTYAPSLALSLGLIEDASGLAVACRQADIATVTADSVVELASRVTAHWHVLTGVTTSGQWSDLRPGALSRVWDACRSAFDVTVIDVGFCLEGDDGAAWARPRNAAARTAVAAADVVVAVADASGPGAARLASAWPGLEEVAVAPVVIARNRVVRGRRRTAQPAARDWESALQGAGVTARVRPLPCDPDVVAASWARARAVGEVAPRSRLSRALDALAAEVVSG